MPSWILPCKNCKNTLLGTDVSHPRLEEFAEELQLQFPADGWEVECPHCGHADTYRTEDMLYRENLDRPLS